MISVVIPVFNRRELVSRALASAAGQTWGGELEVIVVDDASTDGTWDHLQSELEAGSATLKLLRHDANRGVSAARNTAIAQAAGEWIALLDSDDEWTPKKLERQLHTLAESGLLVCHTEEIWIRNGVRVNPHKHHRKYGGRIFAHCVPLCAMSPSSILIHRDVFDAIGLFDETLPACEDYDFFLRMTCRYEVAFLDEPLTVKYGGHEDQLSGLHPAMDRFRVRALDRALSECGRWLTPEEEELARSTLATKARIVRDGAARRQNAELVASMEQFLTRWEAN